MKLNGFEASFFMVSLGMRMFDGGGGASPPIKNTL